MNLEPWISIKLSFYAVKESLSGIKISNTLEAIMSSLFKFSLSLFASSLKFHASFLNAINKYITCICPLGQFKCITNPTFKLFFLIICHLDWKIVYNFHKNGPNAKLKYCSLHTLKSNLLRFDFPLNQMPKSCLTPYVIFC